jgi:SPP1 family phage portal protein
MDWKKSRTLTFEPYWAFKETKMQLTQKMIQGIYSSCSCARKEMQNAELYYEGRQIVPELAEVRADGRPKTQQKTNYTRYIVDNHVSFMLNKKPKYVLKTEVDDTSLSYFEEVFDYNNCGQLDLLNMRNVLLYGFSVEVHSFDGENIVISSTDSDDWAFVRNQNGEIVLAIYKVELEPYTMFEGAMLEDKMCLYYTYDAAEMNVLRADKDGNMQAISTTPHLYGRLPLTIFTGNDEMKPLLDCAFYNCVNMMDIVGSSAIDSLKYDTDSMLYLTGYKIDKLLQKDDQGVSNIAKLRQMNILTGDDKQDAKFLAKQADVEKFRFAYDNLQDNLFLMGYCPNILGMLKKGLTDVSGTALRIAYGIQLAKATEIVSYFEIGLRDRVELINVIAEFLNKPVLEDFSVIFELNMPNNNIELLQYLKNLDGVLAKQDQIKLLSFVNKPEAAYQNLLNEQKNSPVLGTDPASTEDEVLENPLKTEVEE